ncbi:MAG: hypothetical protein HYZ26_00840 [Chloroflexi bacterium]|nr:hypothetical protein [Chloroflexota bacterium]
MDYGKILNRAGEIIWKHKVLWIFGILAGCGAQGNTSSYQMGGRTSGGGGYDGGDMPFQNIPNPFGNLPDTQVLLMMTILILVILVIVILFFVLGVYGRLGLIQGTLRAEASEEITFAGVHEAAMPFLGRAILLNLIVGLAVLGVGLVFAFIAVLGAVATFGLALLCIIPLVCLLVPVLWFVSIIIEQANVALVTEDLSVGDALQRGWAVVRANLGESIVMGLILMVGGGVANLIVSLPLVFAVLPLMAGMFAFADSSSQAFGWGGIGIFLLCIVAYLPVLILASGIIQAYIKSAWTLTFQQLRAVINPSSGEPLPEAT